MITFGKRITAGLLSLAMLTGGAALPEGFAPVDDISISISAATAKIDLSSATIANKGSNMDFNDEYTIEAKTTYPKYFGMQFNVETKDNVICTVKATTSKLDVFLVDKSGNVLDQKSFTGSKNQELTLSANNIQGVHYIIFENKGLTSTTEITMKLKGANTNLSVIDAKATCKYPEDSIVPTYSFTYNGIKLVKGTDYKETKIEKSQQRETDGIRYFYNVTITGIGKYTDSKTFKFSILVYDEDKRINIANAITKGTTSDNIKVSYNYTSDNMVKYTLVHTKNGTKTVLVEGTDYTVTTTYTDRKIADGTIYRTYTSVFKGINKYKSTYTYGIENHEIPVAGKISVKKCDFTPVLSGKTVTDVVVKYNETKLTSGKDYTSSIKNNGIKTEGTKKYYDYSIVVTGKGNYTGEQTIQYKLYLDYSLDDISPVGLSSSMPYTGKQICPKPEFKLDDGTVLIEGKDYTLTYGQNLNVGVKEGTIFIKGLGEYKSLAQTLYFDITPLTINSINFEIADQQYTGNQIKPVGNIQLNNGLALKSGTDYTITYTNNVNVGTATVILAFKGNFNGTVTKTFKITARRITNIEGDLSDKKYTGKEIRPLSYVTTSTGGTLKEGTDYTVSYKNNVNVGTATATITFKGNYTGTVTKTFKIVKSTGTAVIRIAGNNRYSTAVEVSKKAFPYGSDTVIIASGQGFADALAGIPLANICKAPILLADTNYITKETGDEITRLKAKNVIILGGIGVISAKVANIFTGRGLSVQRIAGTDRFATSTLIAEEIIKRTKKPTEVFFVSAFNFPDALSVSSIAAVKNAPIIYAGKDANINENVQKFITKYKNSISKMYAIGGASVVPDSYINKIKQGTSAQTIRLSGKDRFETCLKVNNYFKDSLTGTDVFIASGLNYPDALSGGVYAAMSKSPILLVGKDGVTTSQVNYFNSLKASAAKIIGGTGVVSENIAKKIKTI